MYFRYGQYKHPDNEVLLQSFEQIPIFSERGRRRESLFRMRVTGEIIAEGQAAIAARIEEIVHAYQYDMKDAALYHDDGTVTRHALLTNHPDAVSGTRIVHRSWPRGDPGEYATYRHFSIGFEATYRDVDSEILLFHETLEKYGTGGPMKRWFTVQQGAPRLHVLAARTPVGLVQRGIVVGYSGYPFSRVPGPIYPDLEIEMRRQPTIGWPQFGGRMSREFPLQWNYTMMSPIDLNPVPQADDDDNNNNNNNGN